MGISMIRTVRALVGIVAASFVAACAATPAPEPHPDLTYGHLAPIHLNAASIDIQTRYIPPLRAPNVEHRAPVPPYVAIRRWGEARLKTRGTTNNQARLVILDASIKEAPLATKGGLKGAFVREQAARYDGRLAVLLEIRDPGGRQLAFVTARAERSATVPEGASIAQRERVWLALTEDMMRDLNKQLEDNIRRHFAAYLPRP